jgi:nucleoside-diphosphate-sugar epimerase
VAQQFYKGIPTTRDMGEYETFFDVSKAKRLLGYTPKHGWRDAL